MQNVPCLEQALILPLQQPGTRLESVIVDQYCCLDRVDCVHLCVTLPVPFKELMMVLVGTMLNNIYLATQMYHPFPHRRPQDTKR
eukprot:SAG31_NODE_688_length_12807_cov_6.395814_6_plen_85_part_00